MMKEVMENNFCCVKPVLDMAMRKLCTKPYPGHREGCPNYGKRDTCPPRAPALPDVMALSKPVYVVWNTFDLGAHADNMWALHPEWSARQARCCLYWQGAARVALRVKVDAFTDKECHPECDCILYCPEACGVNVTATMRKAGIELEWPVPAIKLARQVALVGTRKEGE